MATLRALPSISTLLARPGTSGTHVKRTESAPSLHRRVKHGNPCRVAHAASNPRGLVRVQTKAQVEQESRGLVAFHSGDGDESSSQRPELSGIAISELLGSANQTLVSFVKENARELAIGSLVFALVCLPDENAHALGPGGPLFEEFWDNVRRYGFYFFTVVSGGLYSLAKPLLDLLKEPSTQFLVAIAVVGTFYLVYLTVSTMLGLTDFDYQFAQ